MRSFLNKIMYKIYESKTSQRFYMAFVVLLFAALAACIVYEIIYFFINWLILFQDGIGLNPLWIPIAIIVIVAIVQPKATFELIVSFFKRK